MAKTSWKPGNMIYPLRAVMVTCRDKGQDNIITISMDRDDLQRDPPMTYSFCPPRETFL